MLIERVSEILFYTIFIKYSQMRRKDISLVLFQWHLKNYKTGNRTLWNYRAFLVLFLFLILENFRRRRIFIYYIHWKVFHFGVKH